MDCCSHEGPAKGDAKFDFKKIADGVVIVDMHSKPSAARVIVGGLGDITKKPVHYGDYRPWRAGLLRNIERTYAMVS